MTKSKKIMIGALPFAALIVLFAVFCGIVSSKGYRLDMYIKIIFNEGIVLSIVATGAIFIYTLGSFDISLGAATLFSATLGVMTYNATENFILMIVVILLSGIVCSLLNSVLASIFHIPVFVTTVAMMSVLSAIASQIITTKGGAVGGISIPSEVVKHLDTSAFKIIVLVILFWSWWTDLNPRPADYKSAALPTELHQRFRCFTRDFVLFLYLSLTAHI